MGIFDSLDEYMNTGDPMMREWFLVKSNFWPIFLSSMYLLTVKVIGPSIMRDRKPFDLRTIMMIYNLLLVVVYTVCVSAVMSRARQVDFSVLCKNRAVEYEHWTYTLAYCSWIFYVLKYVEFLDTIFFVLRKKSNLITNLHVIHHCALPVCGWVLIRTEKTGFMVFPVMVNSVVHIAMYGYYGLAAMGPGVRKYLWWKRYLTIAQMIQFIVILLFIFVVLPVSGCTASESSVYIYSTTAILFFALFYDFYRHTFKPKKSRINGVHKKQEIDAKKEENGNIHNEISCNGTSKTKFN